MDGITQWVSDVMGRFGYVGIFLLIAIENLFPPIPSEVILGLGGFMTTYSSLSVVGVIISSTLGSVVGAIALYGVGRALNMDRIEKIVDKWGWVLRLTTEDIKKTFAWFDRLQGRAVFFCRFIPLIRSLISIPAGMSRMKISTFLLLTTIGSVIWNTVLTCAGALLGENWGAILDVMDTYSYVAYTLIAVLGVGFIGWFVYTRFIKKKKAVEGVSEKAEDTAKNPEENEQE